MLDDNCEKYQYQNSTMNELEYSHGDEFHA